MRTGAIATAVAWARTALFSVVFYGLSVPIVLLAPVAALFGEAALRRHTALWAWVHRWCARLLLGIRSRVVGTIPTGPVLYAAKHEAMFETIEVVLLFDSPVVVMKDELGRIPLWGWTAKRYGMIVIDRGGGARALRGLMRTGQAAREQGRAVVLFPEGTRVPPGETPPLKPGFAGLYRALGLPVVPVAIDSGRLWPRHGPKRDGIITFRFGEPIPPGLPRAEIEARVHAGINGLAE